jgi:hypothetical protein
VGVLAWLGGMTAARMWRVCILHFVSSLYVAWVSNGAGLFVLAVCRLAAARLVLAVCLAVIGAQVSAMLSEGAVQAKGTSACLVGIYMSLSWCITTIEGARRSRVRAHTVPSSCCCCCCCRSVHEWNSHMLCTADAGTASALERTQRISLASCQKTYLHGVLKFIL